MREIIVLAVGAFFGLGATMASLAAPIYLPNLPPWAVHWLFWGGITLMALMFVDGLCLLAVKPEVPTVLLFNAGLLLLSASAIYQFSPSGTQKSVAVTIADEIEKRFRKAEPGEPYRELTNQDLKEKTIDFAVSMRIFESNYIIEERGRPSWTPDPALKGKKELDADFLKFAVEREKLSEQHRLDYLNKFFPETNLLLEELLRRVNAPTPDQSKNTFGPTGIPPSLRLGSLAGPSPISDGANYLERLARSLL